MAQEKLIFRMAARCEAAGRPNNEDNYQLDSDLSDDQWGFTADEEVELGEKGALLVVCDGMGGMNAGEVASDIAIRTIKDWFAAEKLTQDVLASPLKYIKESIIAADAAIKNHSKEYPETEGMGSTCVMAWMLGKKVYVGWCGDSRCYCYNPNNGLARLSHDHSYVQELVDAGKLTEELAFDHPNNNIITRSLGDPRGAARPDVKEFDLHNEDIIMLCSDGLCGCLRDYEIEEQISAHQTSMQECRNALWAADEAAGWHDNVTIGIAQVLRGGAADTILPSSSKVETTAKKRIIFFSVLAVVAIVVAVLGFFAPRLFNTANPCEDDVEETSSSIENDEENNAEIQDSSKVKDDKVKKASREKSQLHNPLNKLDTAVLPMVQTVAADSQAIVERATASVVVEESTAVTDDEVNKETSAAADTAKQAAEMNVNKEIKTKITEEKADTSKNTTKAGLDLRLLKGDSKDKSHNSPTKK